MDYDVIIAGGGLVGASIAYGLAQKNLKIAVLDGGDRSFRASRGNFGLVWVQGKGWDYPAYAQWGGYAAGLWPGFNQKLQKETGIETDYQRPGGMHFCINEHEWDERIRALQAVKQHTGGAFSYEMLEHAELKRRIPQISKAVIGASYSPEDGHVNPLHLLRALHHGMEQLNVQYLPNQTIQGIQARQGGYTAHSDQLSVSGEKIVLCAGLQNGRLGEMLGMQIPVLTSRGQVLITERLQPFLPLPTLHVRQTAEGTVQIGDSHEDVGLNDGTSPQILKQIVQRAVLMFPQLAGVRLLRAWGALRIMTPDNNPIYQQSESQAGAYAVTCHSGVTLAAAHAGPIADWVAGKRTHELLQHFSTERFNVS